MLVKYVSSKKEMWSHYLDTCAFAYNTSQHDSTKFTPFMLMFGRRARLPIDVELEHQDSEDLFKAYKDLEDLCCSMLLHLMGMHTYWKRPKGTSLLHN